MKQIIALDIHHNDGNIIFTFMLNRFQEEHNIACLCRQTGNARDIHVCTFRTDKKIPVVFDRNRNIVSCFHETCRNSRFFVNVVKSERNLNIIFICRVHSGSFKYRHEVFFGIMNDRHFCIGKRQSPCHRCNLHITKIGGNIITDMPRTICNVKNILNNTICDGVVRFVLNENNVERAQNGIIRHPKLEFIAG